MAATQLDRENPKLNSVASSRKRSGGRPRKQLPAKKVRSKEKAAPSPAWGSMERTRRLLLAALRVWELKRRVL